MQVLQEIRINVPGLGQKIKKARLADGRTMTELAKLAGVSRPAWAGFEEETYGIKLETLKRIEEALGTKLLDEAAIHLLDPFDLLS